MRFSGGRDGTLWYHRAAAEALKKAAPGPLVQELARAVTELEHLSRTGLERRADGHEGSAAEAESQR